MDGIAPAADYFEPWHTRKDRSWEDAYRHPPKENGVIDADYVANWWRDRARAEKASTNIIWGSRMSEPRLTNPIFGRARYWDGRGIIGFSRNMHNMPEMPSHEEVAQRVCDCVNACRGIGDPAKLVAEVRGLLIDIVIGAAGRDDPRVLSCLAHMIPPDELEQLGV